MRKRRGRPRKVGARHRDGHLKRQAESPRVIAAGMPHRKGLGELAVDQRAETELGRLVLRGTLTPDQGLAGETYLSLWRGYVFSLAGPRELSNGGGHGFNCGGCEEMRHCRCWFRRKVFEEAYWVLRDAGREPFSMVHALVTHGTPVAPIQYDQLREGLAALARHFGLQPRKTMLSRNAASEPARSPAP